MMASRSEDDTAIRFKRFEIRPLTRQVWVDGAAVPLGGRAYDLLALLQQHSDRVVPREEILDRVWPGLVVEENNLSVQISTLRRLCGTDVIATVTGRGYQFTAPRSSDADAPPLRMLPGNLPLRQPPLVGREAELAELLSAHDTAPCVTICGLAGIGKTALADAAAQQLAVSGRYPQGTWRVDLTDVSYPDQLPIALCEVLGVQVEAGGNATTACLAALQRRALLLMLDNCEHVVAAVADIVGALLANAPHVHVLATSQEPLRLAGERVMRLNPLAVPLSAEAQGAQAYGAVRLLLQRVRSATGGAYEPSPQELVDLVEICRQLDGIPLALEFAASRVPLLGTAGVRSRLGDRLRLLAGGLRSAPLRHRSLQAALEWSHQLLSPATQQVLHQLSIFPSGFSLEAAQELLGADAESDLIGHLNVLVDRSLVVPMTSGRPRYRFLETTRAFALDCLKQSQPDFNAGAQLTRVMSRICVLGAQMRDIAGLLQEMPNVRAALAWALAEPTAAQAAVTMATYTSVVLSPTGSIGEALDNLHRVQPLVSEQLPITLTARYWHWLGRLGVEGRVPAPLCVQALERADGLFQVLGDTRNRHGCQRHLAEAHLRTGRLDLVEQHLHAARALEADNPRPADRVRRLRVEGLLADAKGQHDEALRHAQTALALAEAHHIDRSRLLLLGDMAWTHLQLGHADAAAAEFQDLLTHFGPQPGHGQARARAMEGLTAALVAAGRIDEARRSALRTARELQLDNLLCARCDIFAWLAAACGADTAAAQLLGASEDFATRTNTERDPIGQLARRRAAQLIDATLSDEDCTYWQTEGAAADTATLMHLLQQTFAPDNATFTREPH